MANNSNLGAAKAAKNDEFYTQYADIQKEINAYLEYNPDTFRDKTVLLPCDDPEWSNFTRFFAQNFERLGLKRLISTSYAVESKKYKDYEPTLFETESPLYDIDKTRIKGKIFELTRDTNGSGRIDIDDLEWHYLEGDGDFRSPEVCAQRDQADIIVTNPPFSLFRDFLGWIVEAEKQFLIIGNMNAITYKEVFPLIKDNRLWLGATGFVSDMVFAVPKGSDVDPKDRAKAAKLGYVGDYTRLGNSCWFTNLEHGRRHQPLQLMTMKDNLRFSKHKEIRENGYQKYDNYDAIEVPYTDAIPSDYEACLGVPISFLDKYCPEQFEIVGISKTWFGFANKVYPEQLQHSKDGKISKVTKLNDGPVIKKTVVPSGETYYTVGKDVYTQEYARIFIKALTPPLKAMSINQLREYVIMTFGLSPEEVTIVTGIMGVPISFLDKYCPEQFNIMGMCENLDIYGLKTKVYSSEECKAAYKRKFGKVGTYDLNASGVIRMEDGRLEKVYQRILIQKI